MYTIDSLHNQKLLCQRNSEKFTFLEGKKNNDLMAAEGGGAPEAALRRRLFKGSQGISAVYLKRGSTHILVGSQLCSAGYSVNILLRA